jgi:hypothetical protein
MTVRVGNFEAPVAPLVPLAVLGFLSTMTVLLVRWWRQPAPQGMSEDWLSDRARIDSNQGWN